MYYREDFSLFLSSVGLSSKILVELMLMVNFCTCVLRDFNLLSSYRTASTEVVQDFAWYAYYIFVSKNVIRF